MSLPTPLGLDELLSNHTTETEWMWDGYLARGSITLLTSRWKSGKTTLIAMLAARLGDGRDLAGSAVHPGQAMIVSEESPALWAQRFRRLGMGEHIRLMSRPFDHRPSAEEWHALIDMLAREPVQLTIIDPLIAVSPASSENNSTNMLDALTPLAKLTAAGQAVLILHHPRKDDGSPRGSGTLQSFVDILMELELPRFARMDDRQRWLRAKGRFVETPSERLIELTPDGLDYRLVEDAGAAEFASGYAQLQLCFRDRDLELTRPEVLAAWPMDRSRPSKHTIWKWLERAVVLGMVERCGSGKRGDPYRYRRRTLTTPAPFP